MKYNEPKFDRMILHLDNPGLLPCEFYGKARNTYRRNICDEPATNLEVFPKGPRVIKEGRKLCARHANTVAKKFNIQVAKG